MPDPLEIDETPRELQFEHTGRSPFLILLAQIRKQTQALNEMLADVACNQFELASALAEAMKNPAGDTSNEWKAIGIVTDRLLALLGRLGVSVKNPAGRPWNDTVKADYDVMACAQRPDVPAPRVAHVDQPLVQRYGKTVRKGKVLVEAPEASTASPDAGPATTRGE